MTELQAEQAAVVPRTRSRSQRSRYVDVLIALAAFAVLAILPMLTGSKALLDFVIRCSAFGLFATSLNLLVGYTGMVSFGHGMFFGLGAYGFGLIMQRAGLPVPVAFVGTLVITTVIGGMGSILGALIGAILIGMIRSFGSLGFPLFTEGLMYLFMVIVLVSRPTGLFGKEAA